MKVSSKIKGGKPHPLISAMIKKYLEANEGRNLTIEIKDSSPTRLAQYGYLHGICYPILIMGFKITNDVVLSLEDVDTVMKLRFWFEEILEPLTGELTKIPKRKRDMNRSEMSEFIQRCIGFGSEYLGVEIPPPSEKKTGEIAEQMESEYLIYSL